MKTVIDQDQLSTMARLFMDMGASEVFLFGSTAKGSMRSTSDIDIAVAGLPAHVYFAAASRASDLLGRPVDLLDLDDDTPLVRYIKASGELVRVS